MQTILGMNCKATLRTAKIYQELFKKDYVKVIEKVRNDYEVSYQIIMDNERIALIEETLSSGKISDLITNKDGTPKLDKQGKQKYKNRKLTIEEIANLIDNREKMKRDRENLLLLSDQSNTMEVLDVFFCMALTGKALKEEDYDSFLDKYNIPDVIPVMGDIINLAYTNLIIKETEQETDKTKN
ncbi:MAG: hypothetical protein ACRCZK_01710 [Oscillospiraceae bacterium]